MRLHTSESAGKRREERTRSRSIVLFNFKQSEDRFPETGNLRVTASDSEPDLLVESTWISPSVARSNEAFLRDGLASIVSQTKPAAYGVSEL